MDTNKFDEIIRKKTDSLEVPYQSKHWEQLARTLDQQHPEGNTPMQAQEAALVDQHIAEKLSQIRTPGTAEQTWPILETRLEEHLVLRQRLFTVKTLEISILVLLLLTIVQWYPRIEPAIPRAFLPREQIKPAEHTQPQAALEKQSFPQKHVRSTSTTPPTPHTSGEERFKEWEASTPLYKKSEAYQIPALTTLEQRSSSSPLVSADPVLPSEVQETHSGALQGMLSIPVIATPQFSTELLMESTQDEESIEFQQPHRKAMLNVAMLGSTDYNRVMTPPNYAFRLRGFDRYTPGYGGGILLGMEYGRIEIGSGLIYAAKEYQPLPVIFVKGSSQKGFIAESLENIQLNLVNLPIYLRYDAIKKDKWRAYVTGGASLQIALGANYFISPPITLPVNTQALVVEGDIQNTTEGWLEGGSFKQNSYVTANLSLGIERFVSERWSVFVQPTYHQSVGYFANGLGPNLDRIHTLSLWTGIRVRVID